MNTTSEVPGSAHSPSYVLLVFSQALAVLIIAGNSLVIVAYRRNAFLHTRTNIFIVSLAVSDLLVGAVSVPIWTYFTFVNFQNILTIFLRIYLCFDIFSALASIFHFTAIAIERCYVISKPFNYGTLTNRVYKILIFTAWLMAAIIAALSQMNTSITLKRVYTVFVFTVGFVLPSILILTMYTKIFRTARSLIRKTPGLETAQAVLCKAREERKVLLTVSILTGLFLMAWLPFFVISMLAEFCVGCLPNGNGMTALVIFVKWMHYSNSVVNPLVIVIRHSEMRKCVLQLCGISLRRERKQKTSSSNKIPKALL
ncbi:dopamine D2-like receptor [Stylophora pistillata]|uniref:dopamine D2-like receptor n=1 Tax=Stylophora pistillata TaxID=50429 RepID=UPI000C04CFCA|nr:dopamine D2-like receptor [Stylophora pistillata]